MLFNEKRDQNFFLIIEIPLNMFPLFLFGLSHVGIKQLVFGGKNLGDWDEDLTSDQPDFRSYKV